MAKPPKQHYFVMGFGVLNGMIQHNNGSVRPVTSQEQHMWDRLVSLDPGLAQDISPEDLEKLTHFSVDAEAPDGD